MSLHSFTHLAAQRRIEGGRVHLPVSEDWLQGRTCYGGLVATLAALAMRDVAGATWPAGVGLRSLHTCFVGPVQPGEVQVDVQVLRQGRHVCHVQAQVRQGEAVAASLMGMYADDRASVLAPRRPQRPPAVREAEDLPAPPARPAGAPAFLQHFDMRWAEGAPPFTGSSGWTSSIHMRLQPEEAESLLPELQSLLLGDLPATPVIAQLRQPAPNSSVTWALELRPVADAPAGGWWRSDNESVMVEHGYVNHASRLWAPDGSLAAFGSQVVAVFA